MGVYRSQGGYFGLPFGDRNGRISSYLNSTLSRFRELVGNLIEFNAFATERHGHGGRRVQTCTCPMFSRKQHAKAHCKRTKPTSVLVGWLHSPLNPQTFAWLACEPNCMYVQFSICRHTVQHLSQNQNVVYMSSTQSMQIA